MFNGAIIGIGKLKWAQMIGNSSKKGINVLKQKSDEGEGQARQAKWTGRASIGGRLLPLRKHYWSMVELYGLGRPVMVVRGQSESTLETTTQRSMSARLKTSETPSEK